MSDQNPRTLPKRITDIYRNWTFQARLLRSVHICLVVVATTSSVLAAAGIGKVISPPWLPGGADPLAALAAIAIGCISAFELGNKANNFRNAWRVLYAAMLRFEEETEYTVEQLIQSYEIAEKLIGDVNVNLRP
jgi:hypothetical protein